jgi:dUTP pyrophosphatase
MEMSKVLIFFIIISSIINIVIFFIKTLKVKNSFNDSLDSASDDPILIKKLEKDAKIPSRNNWNDAGLDFYSYEDYIINPGQQIKTSSKIAIQLPQYTVGMVCDRSSMGVKGIKVFAGIIDESYRGEIMIVLGNCSDKPISIKKGDKIAQMLIIPILYSKATIVEELEDTERGIQGFGSSGSN